MDQSVSLALQQCAALWDKLRELRPNADAKAEKQRDSGVSDDRFPNERYYISQFHSSLERMEEFSGGPHATLANRPALLLSGEAGQGKTHLLCDVAKRDMSSGRPRILLHGGHFQNTEPWAQIIQELGLTCNRDEFLGAIEAAAQASRCRILILIDALNEGEGRSLWNNYLAGMLTELSRFPWLGVGVSVRASYEDLVVPDGLVPDRLVRVEHYGFQELEYEAVEQFFDYYGIQPTVPLLVPEFTNPLFLTLLCKGLQNQGLTQIPTGLQGITAAMSFFIDAANKRLAERLDFDARTPLVRKAVEKLAAALASEKSHVLPRETAKQVVDSVHPSSSYKRSLFHHLLAEGILAEDRWFGDSGDREIVRFTYERFSDHLIVKYLLKKYLDNENPRRSFSKNRTLGQLCKDERACSMNQGLIEALSVQLPERINKELGLFRLSSGREGGDGRLAGCTTASYTARF